MTRVMKPLPCSSTGGSRTIAGGAHVSRWASGKEIQQTGLPRGALRATPARHCRADRAFSALLRCAAAACTHHAPPRLAAPSAALCSRSTRFAVAPCWQSQPCSGSVSQRGMHTADLT